MMSYGVWSCLCSKKVITKVYGFFKGFCWNGLILLQAWSLFVGFKCWEEVGNDEHESC